MTPSIFLAKIIGPVALVVGVGLLFNLKTYQLLMDDFIKSPALIYLGGVVALFFGVWVLVFHNIWIANWSIVITIIGWLGLLKGTWLLIFPRTVRKILQVYQRNKGLLAFHSVVAIFIGVILTFFGYFAI
ncbi:MAG: hypothetical protein GF375_03140 [Candidatus Omnitrophica bacterium]|nr:hypothetical protein [Candidatus Omnitrophota bacterium]MBD3269086.1 hypothetical protein [Candidatus Omnitrophota bacterium]